MIETGSEGTREIGTEETKVTGTEEIIGIEENHMVVVERIRKTR